MDSAVDLRYPIGKLKMDPAFDAAGRAAAVEAIARLPKALAGAVQGLDDAQLDTPYRDGGWTVRQVVHHLADSHINAYVRFKLVTTEDNPPLKGYDQKAWCEMVDATTLPVGVSLQIIAGVHERWVALLRSLGPDAFGRTGVHSENGPVTLDHLLQTYSWHGRHHVAHVTELRTRRGW